MNLSAHWPISNWDVPTRCRETQPKHAPRTRISSHSGRTPTPTFPFLSKPKRNTQSCSSLPPLWKMSAFAPGPPDDQPFQPPIHSRMKNVVVLAESITSRMVDNPEVNPLLRRWCDIGLAMIHTAPQARHCDFNRVHQAVFGGRTECDAVFVADQLRDLGIRAIEFLLILREIYAPARCHREFLQRLIGLRKTLLDERAIFALLRREFPPLGKFSEVAGE